MSIPRLNNRRSELRDGRSISFRGSVARSRWSGTFARLINAQEEAQQSKLKGRARRLDVAPAWVEKHWGKAANMLRRYRKPFCSRLECAIAELTALGVEFDEAYLLSLRETISRDFQHQKLHVPASQSEFDRYHGTWSDSDDTFAYIAGYTPGGAPYGVTWEEMEQSKGLQQADMVNPVMATLSRIDRHRGRVTDPHRSPQPSPPQYST